MGPDRNQTLVALLRSRAQSEPDRCAYTYLVKGETSGACISWGELDLRARAIAAALESRGGSGERALLLYPSGIEAIAAFFGCLYAGVVAVPAFAPRNARDLARLKGILDDARARFALVPRAVVAEIERRFPGAGEFRNIEWLVTDEVRAGDWLEPQIHGGSLAYLQYTSGSTSVPRGVMVSHRNVLANLAAIDQGFAHTADSVSVSWLPHFHDMGLIYGILQPLYSGFSCYLMSPASFTERPLRWLDAISRHQATHSGGPDFAYNLCARKISPEQSAQLDLRSWRVAFTGAEPVRRETLELFARTFSACGFRGRAFYPAYGLAEATLKVSGALPGEDLVFATDPRDLVGCGRAALGTTVEIADPESFTRCALGDVGEIWVAGPSVAQGYWNRPEETERTFHALLSDGAGPFLRTGDLGFLRDGTLFISGRLKDLIIIRGRNHYPQDIELTVERSHPALRAGCAAAFSVPTGGEERLAVAVELERGRNRDFEEIVAAIRHAVAEQHELQASAVVLLKPGGISKTSSGKTQHRLCRERFLAHALDAVHESILVPAEPAQDIEDISRETLKTMDPAERGPLIESYLHRLASRILRSNADPHVPMNSLGLDSLMAAELKGEVESRLGVEVPVAEVLEGATIAELATRISNGLEDPSRAVEFIERTAPAGTSPASFEQERLWFLDQIEGGNPSYHIPVALRLRGPLRADVLERAFNEIVHRHEALRTTFAIADGRPVQVIAPFWELHLSRADNAALIAEEIQKPFDLAHGPLIRATLFPAGEQEHVLLIVLHHVIADAWSVGVLLRELAALYSAFPLPDLPVQYRDFADWQRRRLSGTFLERPLDYWKQQLSGAPRVLELPTDYPRPAVRGWHGASQKLQIPREIRDKVQSLSRETGVTPFMLLLAAFDALLYRYTAQDDIVVGSPIANRNQTQLTGLIGFFAYPLPLRVHVGGATTFRELLARVRKVALDAYANQEAPFAKIMEVAKPGRNTNYAPLFQVMFSVIKDPLDGLRFPGLEASAADLDTVATDFDLNLTLIDEPRAMRGTLAYNTDLFDADTIALLAESYASVLTQCLNHPEVKLSAIKLPEELNSAHQKREKQAIAIASSFTAEPIADSLSFWIEELEIPAKIEFGPYGQVFQQLLDPSSLLARNKHGVNVLLLRLDDWQSVGPLERSAEDFVAAMRAASARSATPHLICFCPGSAFQAGLEESFASELNRMPGVYVVTSAELAAIYPVADCFDRHADELGHIPYKPEFFAALGTMVARKTYAIESPGYKAIVLDCDQTLWKGVCAEDGPLGIEIDAPRRGVQEFALSRMKAGMLLCLASKNSDNDVLAVFDSRPDMILRREHVTARRINWSPKSENIRSLAAQLDLALDSFVFIDDDPVACAEVQAKCPEVLTLQLPENPDDIPRFLDHVWPLDLRRVTEEDRKRTELYQQNIERHTFQKESLDLESFLEGLGLKIGISPMAPAQIPRVSQLTQRTNQFNSTTLRRSEAEIQQLCDRGVFECLIVEVADRFGDYGLVGVMLFECNEGSLNIDTFLLSCRALGRGVEHRMLAQLGRIAVERELRSVAFRFAPTERNRPVLDFLQAVGAKYKSDDAYRFPPEYAAALTYKPHSVSAHEEVQPARKGRAKKPANSMQWTRIARQFRDAGQILAEIRSHHSTHPEQRAHYAAPRTPAERMLAEIWAELLGLAQVGVHDNFFDLGGHSLLAVQILSRVREAFQVELSLNVVFNGVFTVAELSKAIELAQIEQAGAEGVDSMLDELNILSDEEVKALLMEEGDWAASQE